MSCFCTTRTKSPSKARPTAIDQVYNQFHLNYSFSTDNPSDDLPPALPSVTAPSSTRQAPSASARSTEWRSNPLHLVTRTELSLTERLRLRQLHPSLSRPRTPAAAPITPVLRNPKSRPALDLPPHTPPPPTTATDTPISPNHPHRHPHPNAPPSLERPSRTKSIPLPPSAKSGLPPHPTTPLHPPRRTPSATAATHDHQLLARYLEQSLTQSSPNIPHPHPPPKLPHPSPDYPPSPFHKPSITVSRSSSFCETPHQRASAENGATSRSSNGSVATTSSRPAVLHAVSIFAIDPKASDASPPKDDAPHYRLNAMPVFPPLPAQSSPTAAAALATPSRPPPSPAGPRLRAASPHPLHPPSPQPSLAPSPCPTPPPGPSLQYHLATSSSAPFRHLAPSPLPPSLPATPSPAAPHPAGPPSPKPSPFAGLNPQAIGLIPLASPTPARPSTAAAAPPSRPSSATPPSRPPSASQLAATPGGRPNPFSLPAQYMAHLEPLPPKRPSSTNSGALSTPALPPGSALHDSTLSLGAFSKASSSGSLAGDLLLTARMVLSTELLAAAAAPTSSSDVNLNIDPTQDVVIFKDCILGRGAFGTVYQGLYRGIEVAVKLMHNMMHEGSLDANLGPGDVTNFEQEIRILSQLRHPNIVRLYGGCLHEPQFFIVEELLDTSLADHLRARPAPTLPLPETLSVAKAVAKGLAHLHPKIIHRDLKPQNILLSHHGAIKITDFGLARSKLHTYLSTKNNLAGTVAYMAPECLTSRYVDEKCDIYGLGVILWEVVMGRTPWDGLNQMAVIYQVGFMSATLQVPGEGEGCPLALAELIMACMRTDPKQRPSAEEVVEVVEGLEAALGCEGSGVRGVVARGAKSGSGGARYAAAAAADRGGEGRGENGAGMQS